MSAIAEKTVDKQVVVEAVQQRLQVRHPGGANLTALPQSVRHEQDWWYVNVRPDKEPPKQFEYYEALAEVETEMLTQENIIVLLLPTPAE
ncbi:MAG: hypothetical protein M3Y13_02390 [Armatimonadota bacterium]|nr:hypothetical protein [Armatimonadota bacterium]